MGKIVFRFLACISIVCLIIYFSNNEENATTSFNQQKFKPQRRILDDPKSDAQKYYDSNRHTTRLFGSFDLGYYYVNLFVGSPPQKQTVIVDTGSSLTAMPCSGNFELKIFQ